MANTKSAAKRARQSLSRATRNRGVRTRLRTLRKSAGGNTKPDLQKISELISALDKAAKRGLIHHNTANRRKARLNKLVSGGPRK